MAHYQKSLAAAVVLNTAISAVEAASGFESGSLSLIMDAAHNSSDEMALILLYLAFILSQGVSRNLLRTGNLFNSLGLITISGVLVWQAVERFLHRIPFPSKGRFRSWWGLPQPQRIGGGVVAVEAWA
jgi:cobalt-zinc-cadmium efflux system protein